MEMFIVALGGAALGALIVMWYRAQSQGENQWVDEPNLVIDTDPFKKISTNKMAEDMRLKALGEDNGKRELPPLDSTTFDSTEEKIVGAIEAEQTSAQQRYVDEIQTYTNRLNKLNFRKQLGLIDSEVVKQGPEFNQQVDQASRELGLMQEKRIQKERELQEFQEENKISRPPRPYHRPEEAVSLAILTVLFLIETFGNTTFLAKGNELGFFGAIIEATVISFVNLGIAFLLGYLAKNTVHIYWKRRTIGLVVATAFIFFAMFFNLMVAHYREITGTMLEEGGQLAIAAFWENPWGLKDFQSWILFFMGFLFAIISFIDGLLWNDIYPRYGECARDFETHGINYTETYEEYQEKLKHTFNGAIGNLGMIRQRIVGYGDEHDSILDGHGRLTRAYEQHLNHLEHAGNRLLNIYRAANSDIRKGKVPERFRIPWKMTRTSIDTSLPKNILTREEVSKIIDEAELKVAKGESDVQKKYNECYEELKKIL